MMSAWALYLALAAGAEVDARLQEAAALAARQEHAAAADVYRAQLAAGFDGPELRYNLGTLELELDRLGEAVLHLRTARRLDPLDDDVRHNLEVALARRADRLAGEASLSPWLTLGEALPPGGARLALALPLALLGVALLIRGGYARRSVTVALLAVCGLNVGGGLLWLARRAFEDTREAVVLADVTAARKEPSDAAAIAFEAHAGLLGRVVDEQGAFVRVRLDNGLEAWLERDRIGLISSR